MGEAMKAKLALHENPRQPLTANGPRPPSGPGWIKVTFTEVFPLPEVKDFYEIALHFLGEVAPDQAPRVFYLSRLKMERDTVTAQLSAWQEEGILVWEEVA
jgi:hypothetical protein